MVNEDVLAALDYWTGRAECDEPAIADYIEELAAEVRELQNDLAWLVDRTHYWSALGHDDTAAEKCQAVREARTK